MSGRTITATSPVFDFPVPGMMTTGYTADRPTSIVFLTPTPEEARVLVLQANERECRELASRFAAQARSLDGVREIRLTKMERRLIVTVLTDDADLQRDLELQRLFSGIARGSEVDWNLRSRPYGYDSPEADGELLTD